MTVRNLILLAAGFAILRAVRRHKATREIEREIAANPWGAR